MALPLGQAFPAKGFVDGQAVVPLFLNEVLPSQRMVEKFHLIIHLTQRGAEKTKWKILKNEFFKKAQ